jgi:hypothetical protein
VIAEIRLRRDAGELDVFADVVGGTYPFFPPNSTVGNPASAFGFSAGNILNFRRREDKKKRKSEREKRRRKGREEGKGREKEKERRD